eukprot:2366663-Heterocapsa_arctica.AAC.1
MDPCPRAQHGGHAHQRRLGGPRRQKADCPPLGHLQTLGMHQGVYHASLACQSGGAEGPGLRLCS